MTVVGLIFSNVYDRNISEMTRKRTMASVPFGCRYRLIDFALSNMVNSGIDKVGIVTHYNYQSLLDHIGNGKDWDLARRSGGIKILPPFITAYDSNVANKLYSTRLEAMIGINNFINRCTEDYVVLSDCDIICNINLSKVIKQHEESGADLTVVTKKMFLTDDDAGKHTIIESDDEGYASNVYVSTSNTIGINPISTNIYVIKRTTLQGLLLEALAHGYKSFTLDVLTVLAKKRLVKCYEFDGYYAYVHSLAGYFSTSMQLLDPNVRAGLFGIKHRPVMTKVRNSAPTKYTDGAVVNNSLIADGCVIEGEVIDSILFRGVKVGKGTVIKNCILLQDTYIGENCNLNCVITDKNVVIKDGRNLSGHESMPFFIEKGARV
ncbi:MAG: glucose-1-phosphate adenylyltransferase subunit GlgD [Clostridia bacterium]|nr:glucose-1-phosphate adenylyltransferase subunit GlgD [Clostridia bacterium]